jgi:hypothetical protein
VVGQRLVKGVAEIPPMGEVETRRLDQLPLRANALEEQDQLQLEEDDRVDRRSADLGVAIWDQVAHKAEIERALQMAVEVIRRDEIL